MSQSRLACRLMALSLAAAGISCGPLLEETVPPPSLAKAAPVATVPVVLTPALDYRPASLRRAHDPVQSRMFNTFLFFLASVEEGPLLYGDSRTRLNIDGVSAEPVDAFDRFLRSVVGATLHTETLAGPAVGDPDRLAESAALLPQGTGVVIVPVLDQMDACKLVSRAIKAVAIANIQETGTRLVYRGRSRYSVVHDVVVTSKTNTWTGASDVIGNIRARLLLFRFEGGRLTQRSTIYAAGYGKGLAAAMKSAETRIVPGLQAFLGRGQPD